MNSESRIRILIIGCGRIGQIHADTIRRMIAGYNADIAVFDLDKERLRNFNQIFPTVSIFFDYTKAVADFKPNAIVLALEEADDDPEHASGMKNLFVESIKNPGVRYIFGDAGAAASAHGDETSIEIGDILQAKGAFYSPHLFSRSHESLSSIKAAAPDAFFETLGVEVSWGENFIAADNPSIVSGVLQGVIVALAVVLNADNLKVYAVNATKGSVPGIGGDVEFDLSTLLTADGIPVMTDGSLAWEDVDHRITVYFRGKDECYYIADLIYGIKQPDGTRADVLTVYKLDPSTGRVAVENETQAPDFDLFEFYRGSLNTFIDPEHPEREILTYAKAFKIKRSIDEIMSYPQKRTVRGVPFGPTSRKTSLFAPLDGLVNDPSAYGTIMKRVSAMKTAKTEGMAKIKAQHLQAVNLSSLIRAKLLQRGRDREHTLEREI